MLQAPWQHESPPSIADFTNGLFEVFEVPVSPSVRQKLPFRRVSVQGDCEVVSIISSFLLSFVDTTGETLAPTVSWVHQLLKVLTVIDGWMPELNSLGWHVSVDAAEERSMNTHTTSQGSGESKARPHFVVTANLLSMAFGQCTRGHVFLDQVWSDMKSYFPQGFNKLFYSSIPYLPLFVASGNKLQFGIVQQAGMVDAVGPVLDMALMEERLDAVVGVVNMYRIMRGLLDLAPEQHERVCLGLNMKRAHGVNVLLTADGRQALKTVPMQYFDEYGTTADTVQAAHECANSCSSLVHNSSFDRPRWGNSKATMTKLGLTKAQLSTDEEKQAAVRCCLQALEHLHRQRQPLMHCDVRLLNVLWGPEPFLSDLELVHREPWKPDPDVRLTKWRDARTVGGELVEGTLDRDGAYTCMSDVFQVGVMLEELQPMSKEGRAFTRQLLAKQWTAAQALQQPFMQPD